MLPCKRTRIKFRKYLGAVLSALVVLWAALIVFGDNFNSEQVYVQFSEDVSVVELEVLAERALRAQPGKLYSISPDMEISDIAMENSKVTSRQIPIGQEIDHPKDQATHFLYTDIGGYRFSFSFDECGHVVWISNTGQLTAAA